MIASSYPLLDAFWTMLWFFGFFIWIWLLIIVFSDIFRSHDLSGWGKAFWTLGIFIVPFFGVLIYLIARGGKMHERAVRQAQAQDDAFKAYVAQAATSSGGTADQLTKLADLRQSGALTEEEYQQAKSKLLAA
jgi:ABC-type multidrug transport system fused ATPase/permease subunit